MKKILLTIALAATLISANLPAEEVYICKGPASKRYHMVKDCRGLSNCSTAIYKVTKKDAVAARRTLCKLED